MTLIALNRQLKKNRKSIERARKNKNWTKHLLSETFENSQTSNAKCFSKKKWKIECSCVNVDSIARLRFCSKVNMIFASSTMISKWCFEIKKHLNFDDVNFKWRVRHAYDDKALFLVKLSRDDYFYFARSNDQKFSYKVNCSNMICVISIDCYDDQVVKIFQNYIQSFTSKEKRKSSRQLVTYSIVWDRAIVDETHLKVNKNSRTIQRMRMFDRDTSQKSTRKWFLFDTSFERDSKQIATWMRTLQNNIKKWFNSSTILKWKMTNEYRVTLKNCTKQKLKELDKKHQKLFKKIFEKIKSSEKEKHEKEKQDHIEMLSKILQTIWLRRNVETSRFFDHSLVMLLKHKYIILKCKISKVSQRMFQTRIDKINQKLRVTIEKRRQIWQAEKNNSLDKLYSTTTTNVWMRLNRKLRILNIFSTLKNIDETKNLEWTSAKITKNKWTSKNFESNHVIVKSSYSQNIDELTNHVNASKLTKIRNLIKNDWEREEKIVFCTMSSINALILYWVSRLHLLLDSSFWS